MMALPGAGKTTWIRNNCFGDVSICSSDHWYEDETGAYRFDPIQRGLAHAACLRKYVYLISRPSDPPPAVLGRRTVVVDNTNTAIYDIAPYIHVATAFGYVPEIIHLECDPAISEQRNVHQVPGSVIEHMHYSLTKLLEHWPAHWPTVQRVTVPENGGT